MDWKLIAAAVAAEGLAGTTLSFGYRAEDGSDKLEGGFAVRTRYVTAREVCDATRGAFLSWFTGDDSVEHVSCKLCAGLTLKLTRLLQKLGDEIKVGRTKFVLPTWRELFKQLDWLERESNRLSALWLPLLTDGRPTLEATVAEFRAKFLSLTQAQQEQAAAGMQKSLAIDLLIIMLVSALRDELQQLVPASQNMRAQVQALATIDQFSRLIVRGRQQVLLMRDLLDLYFFWRPCLPSQVIEEFLPSGLWPCTEEEARPNPQPSEAQPVASEDPRIDPARLEFYRAQGCDQVVEASRWFRERSYVAFLLRLANGTVVAILDCVVVGNAAYLFLVARRGEQGSRSWAADAQRSKGELVHQQAGPTFLRRFIHAHGWQQRMRQYLTELDTSRQ